MWRRRALWLAAATVGYNVLEGALSVFAGRMAGSMALTGFGLDSFVESFSGLVILWRFRRPGLGGTEEERREKKAIRLIGVTFLLLGGYVAFESLRDLVGGQPPEPSILGVAIAAVSLVAMPLLYLAKRRVARAMESGSVMADATQTLACTLLSAALLTGLLLNWLAGWWWADPVVGVLIAGYLVKEGLEAMRQGRLCSC